MTASEEQIPLFSLDQHTVCLDELLAYMAYTGELRKVCHITEQSIHAMESASDQEFSLDSVLLQKMANDLRYRLRLVTAESLETWMNAARISLDDINEYIVRYYWHEYYTISSRQPDKCELTDKELKKTLSKDIFFYDHLQENVVRYIYLLIIHDLFPSHLPEPTAAPPADNPQLPHSQILADTLNDEFTTFFDKCHHSYRTYCEKEISDTDHQECITRIRHELLHFTFLQTIISDRHVANEIYQCCSVDNEDFVSIIQENGLSCSTQDAFLDELPGIFSQDFIPSQPGQCLKPIFSDDKECYYVNFIIEKTEPSLESPGVRSRVHDAIIHERLKSQLSYTINWQPAMNILCPS